MTENITTTDVATVDSNTTPVRKVKALSTVKVESFEDRVNVLNILGASEPVSESLNKVIQLVDVIVQPAEMVNEETGEFGEVPRITLIDKDGKSFRATSGPLHSSLLDILFIMGHPNEWAMPLPVKVVKQGSGTRKYFVLQVAPLGSK